MWKWIVYYLVCMFALYIGPRRDIRHVTYIYVCVCVCVCVCVYKCWSFHNVMSFQVLVSCLMLLTIAVERYISIVCPLKHHSLLNKRNATIIIIICWIYGLIIGSLPLFGWNSINVFNIKSTQVVDISGCSAKVNCTQALNISQQVTSFRCSYQNVISGSYAGFMYPGHFVVMWFIMLVLYGHIYLKTRNRTSHSRFPNGLRRLSLSVRMKEPAGKKYSKRTKENWKAIRILAVIVGYFIFSWLGMVIWYGALYKGFTLDSVRNEDPPLPYWFYNVAIILAFGNSVLNPFIYGLGHRGVRKAFLATLPCDKSRKDDLNRQMSPRSLTSHKINQSSFTKDFIPMANIGKSANKSVDLWVDTQIPAVRRFLKCC